LTSHCRHAAVTAAAACWAVDRDGRAHAAILDADLDGEPDLILKNDRFFAMATPRWGGRIVALFFFGGDHDAMVVGNPCDDWNFLEDLNKFMDHPRNHPGAFADVGFENDQYACTILEQGERAVVRLTNVERQSAARGLEKIYEFDSSEALLTVRYCLPEKLHEASVECALSPDYLALLRNGSKIIRAIDEPDGRGFAAGNLVITLEPDAGLLWKKPEQEWIGHSRTLRIGAARRKFELRLRVSVIKPEEDKAPAPLRQLQQ